MAGSDLRMLRSSELRIAFLRCITRLKCGGNRHIYRQILESLSVLAELHVGPGREKKALAYDRFGEGRESTWPPGP